jgi:hypothetical protein
MIKQRVLFSGGPFGGELGDWDVPQGMTTLPNNHEDVLTAGDGLKYRYRFIVDNAHPAGGYAIYVGAEG